MEVQISFVVCRRAARRPRCVADQLVSTNPRRLHLWGCCNAKICFASLAQKEEN
jgi:hypothetical protein